MTRFISTGFDAEEIASARICKALAHPARIAILRFLSQQTSCLCGQIVDYLPLAQATVSQHLKELKEAGLIQGEIDGPRVCYCIDPVGWSKAQSLLRSLSTIRPCC